MNFPALVSVAALTLMVLSLWVGDTLRKRAGIPEEDKRHESAHLMLGAILTLLFFLIGFLHSLRFTDTTFAGSASRQRRSPSARRIPGPICWFLGMRQRCRRS